MLGYRKTFQEWLRGLGYDSHINEALYKYLVDEGITPTQLNDMWSKWLTNNNHTGNTLNEKYMSFVNDVLLTDEIITASVSPATQSVADGDTWADLLLASATNTANYSSTAGTISSAVAEIQVDGGAWTALSGNTATALSDDEVIATRVTVTDSAANDRIFLGGTVTVSGIAPSISGVPTIAGTETVGETLTATAASVTGTPTPTRTWQWERSGVAISGATSATYTLVAADEGETLTVVQTETNNEGTDTAESTATGTISAAASGTITIDTLTYTRGTAGVAPDLATTVSSTGTTTGDYTLYWATRSTGTALSKSAIENGTGDALDNGSITASALADLDGSLDLSTSLTSGAIDAFIRDSSGTAIESDVVSETGVTYDAAAPVFSSAEIGNTDDTSLIVTFDKALYGSTSAADWDVQVAGSPATESAAVISGSTVDITLSAAVTNGQAVTVAFNGTGLVGVDAEQVATFTAETVTNNVAAASGPTLLAAANATANPGSPRTFSIPAAAASGNTVVVGVWYSGASTTFTSLTANGLSLTERGTELVQGTAKMRLFDVAIDTAAGFDVVLTTGGAFAGAGVLVWDAGLLTYSSREDYAGNNPTTSNSIAITSSETAGKSLLAACCAQHAGANFSTGTNIGTLDEAADTNGSFTAGAAHEDSIVGGASTTYAMSYGSAFKNIAGIFGFYS